MVLNIMLYKYAYAVLCRFASISESLDYKKFQTRGKKGLKKITPLLHVSSSPQNMMSASFPTRKCKKYNCIENDEFEHVIYITQKDSKMSSFQL